MSGYGNQVVWLPIGSFDVEIAEPDSESNDQRWQHRGILMGLG
jgi:hypothetical protein